MPDESYNSFQPSGYDRADGLDGRPGTPTPDGAVQAKTSDGSGRFFEELPDSPQIERGEQTTITHRFKCDVDTGLGYIGGLQRGQLLTDSYGNITKILSSTLDYSKGDVWVLGIVAEGVAGVTNDDGVSVLDVPPDEFSVETIELNPSIYRHPRYSDVLNYNLPSSDDYDESDLSGPQIIQLIQAAVNLPQQGGRTEANSQLNDDNISDADVLALAQELLTKVQQGYETFYLAGFKVTYSLYSFYPPDINPGSYVEDPVTSGNLPSYFWSDDGSGDTDTNIFTALAQQVAPAFYSGDNGNPLLSWLRQADVVSYQRTWFKQTMTWIGAPYGVWDADIYNPQPIPPAAS